jgi:DNA (cytosine-5)-methyltransferase 1
VNKPLLVADLFCGAGGSSTGAERAVKELGKTMILTCVNHWPVAIETHRRNHPTARHYLEDVSVAKPQELVPEGYLDLLMASPECTHFSRARGGKPVNDQSRMNPWAVIRWLTDLDVRCLLVENVPEFVNWGPLGGDSKPIDGKKGLYFEAWIRTLWELGYHAEWRYLNAADYGDATTRRRFFLIARKDDIPICWPEPTYSRPGDIKLEGELPAWRAAREIIEWDKPGRSLLDDPWYKKRPLSINTRRRIARGLQKYGGRFASLYIDLLGLDAGESGGAGTPEPFIMGKQQSPAYRNLSEPLPTATTESRSLLIEPSVEPFVTNNYKNNNRSVPRSTDQPIFTVTSTGANLLVEPVIEPFIMGQQSCGAARSVDNPIPTVTSGGYISLIEPQLVVFHGTSETKQINEPLPSLPTKAHVGLVEPQIISYYGNSYKDTDIRTIDEPLATVTTKERLGLVEPLIVQIDHSDAKSGMVRTAGKPLPVILAKQNIGIAEPTAEPFIVQNRLYYGSKNDPTRAPHSIDKPLPAVTGHGAGAIVTPVLQDAAQTDIDPQRIVVINGVPHVLDIRFRMLSNKELSRAMGFDDAETEYEFVGTATEVTKQIGNAVPVNMAAALVKSIFEANK